MDEGSFQDEKAKIAKKNGNRALAWRNGRKTNGLFVSFMCWFENTT
jgi:hypothetical protein